jgi:hypothetical protein
MDFRAHILIGVGAIGRPKSPTCPALAQIPAASSPDPIKHAAVLGPVKMLWGSSGETYLSLH